METFDYRIQTDNVNIERAVKVVLQSVCFHRLFGTIKPATYKAFGMTFPMVGEAEVDQLIEDKARQASHQMQSSAASQVELLIFFLHPSATMDSKIGGTSLTAPSSGTGLLPPGVAVTAANAASSLRAWASPRSYSYNWLAHAFSGGAGQAGGGSVVPLPHSAHSRSPSLSSVDAAVQEEYTELTTKAFERWTISFTLTVPTATSSHTSPSRTQSQEMTARSLADFMDTMLNFVEQKKNHIPAITSAELCPFPLRILVRSN